MPAVNLNVEITAMAVRNATVAEAHLTGETGFGSFPIADADGSAKREQGDVRHDGIGYSLAIGRALVNLGNKLQREAQHAVTAAAAERAEREAAKAAVAEAGHETFSDPMFVVLW